MQKSPLQQITPIIGMTIGVILGIVVSLVIEDRSILNRILGREANHNHHEDPGPRT